MEGFDEPLGAAELELDDRPRLATTISVVYVDLEMDSTFVSDMIVTKDELFCASGFSLPSQVICRRWRSIW